ncbi:hypothetical protein J4Q44_G00291580 [Coregonus suidteri]|uniref:C2H2-type domain-containing protein n=1 Tax=Coregonus suidteri TaxID=861788 RepID=A0AAN8L8U3_9TELE
MSQEKGKLMDEIEKSLWNLTEANLRYLCECHGEDASEVKGMDHRSLRRKIMEEMWDNTDSMKSEEQGMSWLVQLKEDIRRILKDASGAPMSPSQADDDAVDCDVKWNGEGGAGLPSNEVEPVSPSQADDDDAADCDAEDTDWLPSNGLEAEPVSPNQSDDYDAADGVEELDREVRDWMASDGLEVELSPEKHTPEQKDKCRPPKTPCRASPGSTLLRGFMESGALKKHGVTHEEKQHLCPDCGKTFRVLQALSNHQRTKHQKINEQSISGVNKGSIQSDPL